MLNEGHDTQTASVGHWDQRLSIQSMNSEKLSHVKKRSVHLITSRCEHRCASVSVYEELVRAKMSSTKGESRDRNICRIGCGRPGQRDYG